MELLINMLTALLPLWYGLAAANYVVLFIRDDNFSRRTATPLLAGAAALHVGYIILRIVHFERHPIATLGESLDLIAFAVVAVYLYVERIQHSRATGAFIVPTAVILQLAASALMPNAQANTSPILKNTLFGVHSSFAVLGYSAFAVGAAYGFMYLLMYRALKQKQFGLIFDRLPSLDILSKMGFGASLLGWIFLTVTIALGVILGLQIVPNFYMDPKFLSTLVVWGIYGLYVLAYFAFGWRGARSVYIGLVGFTVALVTMFGSAFLWSSFHRFSA